VVSSGFIIANKIRTGNFQSAGGVNSKYPNLVYLAEKKTLKAVDFPIVEK
jgi:hypothetical protein